MKKLSYLTTQQKTAILLKIKNDYKSCRKRLHNFKNKCYNTIIKYCEAKKK